MLHALRMIRLYLRRRLVVFRHRVNFLGDEVSVAPGNFIARDVTIGRRTKILGAGGHIETCTIGSYCALGGALYVLAGNHHTQYLALQEESHRRVVGSEMTLLRSIEPPSIGHGTWIGYNVVVLPGVTIGNGAIIGAGSVVTKSVPDYAVAVGNPARVLKYRFSPEIIEQLKKVEWWTWDDETLRRNRHLFEVDLTAIEPAELARLFDERS